MAERMMRNLMALSVAFVMLAGSFLNATQPVYAASGDTTVYITKTGECYHTGSCSSLKKSKIPVTMQEAVDMGMRPCSRCKPGSIDKQTKAAATKSSAAKSDTKTTTTTVTSEVQKKIDALKKYAGNTKEFNAYNYYMNNPDLQTAIGPNGDALLKHYNDYGKAEGRSGK